MEIEKLIERLQNWDGIKPDREIDCAIEGLKALQAENDRLRRERGAAVESIPHECKTCLYYTVTFNGCTPDYDCTNLDGGCSNNYDRWVWRGPKED